MADRTSARGSRVPGGGGAPELSRRRAALYYAIVFAGVLLVLELAVRVVVPGPPPELTPYAPHEIYDYVRVPYEPFEVPPKPPGEHRILLLGDSLSAGWGAREPELAFAELLRARLAREAPDWRFVNSGVGGWGPVKQRLLLEHEFDRIQPDLVLVQVSLGNDVTDATGATRKVLFDGHSLLAESVDTPVERLVAWIRLHSRLVYAFVGAIKQIPMLLARHDVEPPYPDTSWRTFIDRPPWVEGRIWAITVDDDPFYERGLEILKENYAAIGRIARSGGAEVLFVLVPSRTQVIEPLRRYQFELNGIPDDRADPMKLNRVIVPFVEEQGMSVLDLTPRILARPEGAPMLYYTHWDGHLNPDGHRFMADLMWDEWIRPRIEERRPREAPTPGP